MGLGDAALDIGDPLAGQRMGTQERWREIVIGAAGGLQAAEERDHAGGIEICLLQDLEPDPIGLALGIAAEIELALDRQAFGTHQHRRRAVRSGLRRQHREQDTGQRQQRILALLAEHAGDVALGDVTDFMGHHRRQFRLALRRQHQPRMHGDETAR